MTLTMFDGDGGLPDRGGRHGPPVSTIRLAPV